MKVHSQGHVVFPAEKRGEGRASDAFTQPRSWKSERPDTEGGGGGARSQTDREAFRSHSKEARTGFHPRSGNFAVGPPFFVYLFSGKGILILLIIMLIKTHNKKINGPHPSTLFSRCFFPTLIRFRRAVHFLSWLPSYSHSEIE